MFDRFTDLARKAMGLAREESLRFRNAFIAPEHLLLALVETEGVTKDALGDLGVDGARLRRRLASRMTRGRREVTLKQIPFTPDAKRVLECALEEAGALGHNYIGTEHLVLGLARLEEAPPATCSARPASKSTRCARGCWIVSAPSRPSGTASAWT